MFDIQWLRDWPLPTGVALMSVATFEATRLAMRPWFDARRRRAEFGSGTRDLLARVRAEEATDVTATSWAGWRRFQVASVVEEAEGVRSLILAAEDGKPIPTFVGGQFVTVRVTPHGTDAPSVRCYSISDDRRADGYRITVKRGQSTKGVATRPSVSFHLTTVAQLGDTIDLQAPRGEFVVDLADPRPPVFVGAGIGVTPLFAMAKQWARHRPGAPAIFAYGVRNASDHAFREELQRFMRANRAVAYFPSYSRPRAQDRAGFDYVRAGRLELSWLRPSIATPDRPFYLCGPSEFIADWSDALRAWGVLERDIRTESFGPSSQPRRAATSETARAPSAARPATKVTFLQGGKTVDWTPDCESLLDLANKHGLALPEGCRVGSCGTCAVTVAKGTLRVERPTALTPEPGQCFACVASPAGGEVEIDA